MIRQTYKGHLTRYRDPAGAVARVVERRRQRKAEDPEYRDRLREQAHQHRVLGAHRASMAVARAIKRGELVRPDSCEECGRTDTLIEAAHYDYSRQFDVRWLCRSCHRRWDRDEPKTTEADRTRIYRPKRTHNGVPR